MGAKAAGFKRSAAVTEMPLRRDSTYPNDYADDYGDDAEPGVCAAQAGSPLCASMAAWFPRVCGAGWRRARRCLLLAGGGDCGGVLGANDYLLHDAHFVVPDSESIQIAGNSHLTRAQLLSVFGEDVDRNIFTDPAERSGAAELESLPWVEHATVMRLLPNRVRVAIRGTDSGGVRAPGHADRAGGREWRAVRSARAGDAKMAAAQPPRRARLRITRFRC